MWEGAAREAGGGRGLCLLQRGAWTHAPLLWKSAFEAISVVRRRKARIGMLKRRRLHVVRVPLLEPVAWRMVACDVFEKAKETLEATPDGRCRGAFRSSEPLAYGICKPYACAAWLGYAGSE